MDDINNKSAQSTEANKTGEAELSESPTPAEEQLAAEIASLKRELENKDREAKQNYDRFLRQAAELENFKKRAAKEKEEAIRYGNEALIRDLLPVLDNLERAVSYAQGGGNGKPLLEGVEMVLKSFVDVLAKYGVKQISAQGEPFDPEKHEAIGQVETEEFSPNTVVAEHHKGYFLLDRLLRPALVTTAKPPAKKTETSTNGEVENGGDDG
ncbi:MAG TPA: nucleotide exchange factor GrpE [Candidatus Acidoferrales bacterium]|nr:nucleotide exchange factor GrpE [Candidatus Acidoferrales bacterium]